VNFIEEVQKVTVSKSQEFRPMADFIDELVEEFRTILESSPDVSVGIAVMRILTSAIKKIEIPTFSGVDPEVCFIIDAIERAFPELPLHFRGAAQGFRAAMAKTSKVKGAQWKAVLIEHAERCLDAADPLFNVIPSLSFEFLQHGMVVLTRGYDPMVRQVIDRAASIGRRFHVVISEGRPRDDGVKLASAVSNENVQVTIIPDSSIGLWMNRIHAVLLGTDLVLEDGGLLAPAGTYNMCVMASIHRRPVYCVCETFKFVRKFVLGAPDLANFQRERKYQPAGTIDGEPQTEAITREFDYTPSHFVTLLLTEKGPLPPNAVTHELTKLMGGFVNL
jgi:translation initiation factor 2B subunit (eIF-2B alpha/beta/delta family)